MGIVPLPLNASQTAAVVELLGSPPEEEKAELVDLFENRIPPGVDEAAYVKAGYLNAITKGTATSPVISKLRAVELLASMQGGYNIQPLVDALDDAELSAAAAEALGKTTLIFDAFNDVDDKANAGNAMAQKVLQMW